jgi:hypothetical protein
MLKVDVAKGHPFLLNADDTRKRNEKLAALLSYYGRTFQPEAYMVN